jgi:hypothetical protein
MPNFCRDNLCLYLKTLISCVAMLSSGNQNVDGDVARSSSRQIDMEEQYRLMALESQQEDGEYRPSDDDDADADDDAEAGDDYERRVIDQETTDSGIGAGGSETSSQEEEFGRSGAETLSPPSGTHSHWLTPLVVF